MIGWNTAVAERLYFTFPPTWTFAEELNFKGVVIKDKHQSSHVVICLLNQNSCMVVSHQQSGAITVVLLWSVWVSEKLEVCFWKEVQQTELLNSWVDSRRNGQLWISGSRGADLNSFDAESSLGTTVITKKNLTFWFNMENKSQQSLLFNIFLGESLTHCTRCANIVCSSDY